MTALTRTPTLLMTTKTIAKRHLPDKFMCLLLTLEQIAYDNTQIHKHTHTRAYIWEYMYIYVNYCLQYGAAELTLGKLECPRWLRMSERIMASAKRNCFALHSVFWCGGGVGAAYARGGRSAYNGIQQWLKTTAAMKLQLTFSCQFQVHAYS